MNEIVCEAFGEKTKVSLLVLAYVTCWLWHVKTLREDLDCLFPLGGESGLDDPVLKLDPVGSDSSWVSALPTITSLGQGVWGRVVWTAEIWN